jgi:diaminopimelate epimerase
MRFAKMQATGNDFVLVEADAERDWSRLATSMCDRHFGVGSDGLILLTSSQVADLGMRFFNPDGSEAEACGNGLRSLTKYAVDRGYPQALTVETLGGVRKVQAGGGLVRVDMGVPILSAKEIPVATEGELDIIRDYPIVVDDRRLLLTCLSLGNPHAVCFPEEPVADFPLVEVGPKVENHPAFPQRVNFEVANVASRKKIVARVWERGAGQTLSSGSGACAVVVAAHLHDRVDDPVDVILPGGTLTIEWDGAGKVMLSGPAELVFLGEWPD